MFYNFSDQTARLHRDHDMSDEHDVPNPRLFKVFDANGKRILFVKSCGTGSGEVTRYEVRRIGDKFKPGCLVFLMTSRQRPATSYGIHPALLTVVQLGKDELWFTEEEFLSIPLLEVPT